MNPVVGWVRRNAVVLIGVFATVAASLIVVGAPGVYWVRAELVLLPPSDQGDGPGNIDDLTASSLTSSYAFTLTRAAGVVESVLRTSDTMRPKYGSANVTLPDTGVSSARSVVVPDTGDQWNWSFARQVLDVQVVDSDREVADERMDRAIIEVNETLEAIQDEMNVPSDGRIRAVSISASRQMVYRDGEPARALAMTIVLGASITVAAYRFSTRR